eukprot:gnl/MRDRNA2_/MRDRNA2_132375_c0_seq1.p1 gnl/MRDRNA2_/MRDRNA2_132375_c0~~gnl/MRDRNA2_/MRDRNA2_132375_c0_seq1.p1  ORF type:complete len:582 (+),score=64.91 gnl/MRDRNA2_/MRDRNA2_132375_c0_seq1:169-1914(+)
MSGHRYASAPPTLPVLLPTWASPPMKPQPQMYDGTCVASSPSTGYPEKDSHNVNRNRSSSPYSVYSHLCDAQTMMRDRSAPRMLPATKLGLPHATMQVPGFSETLTSPPTILQPPLPNSACINLMKNDSQIMNRDRSTSPSVVCINVNGKAMNRDRSAPRTLPSAKLGLPPSNMQIAGPSRMLTSPVVMPQTHATQVQKSAALLQTAYDIPKSKEGVNHRPDVLMPASHLGQSYSMSVPEHENNSKLSKTSAPKYRYQSEACNLGQHDYSTTPMYTPNNEGVNKMVWQEDPFYGWLSHSRGSRQAHQHNKPHSIKMTTSGGRRGSDSGSKMIVRVMRAYDLRDAKADTFVQVSIPGTGQLHKTGTASKSSNPKWNSHPIEFQIDRSDSTLKLLLEVITVGNQRGHLGSTEVLIRELLNTARRGASPGESVSIRRHLKSVNNHEIASQDHKGIGVLSVKVIAAYNLINTDSGIGIGNFRDVSDPYCSCTVGGVTKRTETINNDLNPRWKKNQFQFPIKTGQENIEFVVMDSDTMGNDDFLGRIEIPMDGVLSKAGEAIALRDQLWDVPHGEIEVELSFNYEM